MNALLKAAPLGLLCVTTTLLAGCGNFITADVRGQVGLTRANDGAISIVVQPCGLEIDSVEINGPLENPSVENVSYRRYSTESPESDFFHISLDNPDEKWTVEVSDPLPENANSMLLVTAWVSGKDAQVHQLTTTYGDVSELDEGWVVVGRSSSLQTIEDFHQCSTPVS
ncbi:putative secreted protein [Corynebacterium deserti GIMN1.010]|uniref:Putative secreted protein n=1 Tax=Corynebacterium deserti GIMN1.010 TaxID=931089 RepID=A0A0M4CIA3_9CORY|nr:hypothetical protein [Corynebacterium deserti]ALC05188.1 putative secreted protein [Corynebacterium deserti GIMN1.010]